MSDGNYLYRHSRHDWWRACTIKDGKLYARWRVKPALLVNGWLNPPNEFIGPLDDENRDWMDASAEPMGRLFREPAVVTAPPPA